MTSALFIGINAACGTGNFLTEILSRKLRVVERKYRKSLRDYERNAVHAVSCIYGIDIQEDNVQECCNRLFNVFDAAYTGLFKTKANDKCRNAIRFILKCNIVQGDALTLMTVGDCPKPIIFSQWSPVVGSKFKRHDFAFRTLMQPDDGDKKSLFAMHEGVVENDLGGKGFIPVSIKDDYRPTNFWELEYV